MKGDYPHFRAGYGHEELVEHFLLTPDERSLISQLRGDVNRHGAAVLLKSLLHLGYFPDDLAAVPTEIKEFIAKQLALLWDISAEYPTDERTRRYHLALIRKYSGWRFPTAQDKEELERWLRDEGARAAHAEEDLLELAYERLRTLHIQESGRGDCRRATWQKRSSKSAKQEPPA